MRPVALVASALLLPVTALAALGPRHGGAIGIGVVDLRPDLSSGYVRGAGTRLVRSLLHEPLVRVGSMGEPLASLASSWHPLEDGSVWVVDLAEEARFHDERTVEATDVVRSLRRFLRTPAPSAVLLQEQLRGGAAFAAGNTEDLQGLEVAGRRSFVLRLIRPSSGLPVDLGSPSAGITATDDVGAGPFRLLHSVRNERLRLVAWASHVRGRPLLDEIDIRRHAETSSLSRAFEQGRLDLAVGVPDQRRSSAALLLLRLEVKSGPFQSFGERLRLEAALDRGTLAERFVPGGRAVCDLLLAADGATLCPAPSPTEPREGANRPRRPLRLAVDLGVPPATSRRVVAHLLSLGFDPTLEVALPDEAPPQADLRLLLFIPEGPDAVAGLVEAAGLAGRADEMAARLAPLRRETDPRRVRLALDDAQRELLAGRALIPLASMSSLSVGSRLRGLQVGFLSGIALEDAWVPL